MLFRSSIHRTSELMKECQTRNGQTNKNKCDCVCVCWRETKKGKQLMISDKTIKGQANQLQGTCMGEWYSWFYSQWLFTSTSDINYFKNNFNLSKIIIETVIYHRVCEEPPMWPSHCPCDVPRDRPPSTSQNCWFLHMVYQAGALPPSESAVSPVQQPPTTHPPVHTVYYETRHTLGLSTKSMIVTSYSAASYLITSTWFSTNFIYSLRTTKKGYFFSN